MAEVTSSLKSGELEKLKENSLKARFLLRKNRFVGRVAFQGEEFDVYVPNTGRCEELLFSGNEVLLKDHGESKRKYRYSVLEAKKDHYYVPMDSTLANRLVESYLLENHLNLEGSIQREVKTPYDSRLDFKVGNTYIEVKSVTLDEDGVALFPDAPTLRGEKHLQALKALKNEGFRAMMIYVIFTDSKSFSPHPARGSYQHFFKEAVEAGVEILPIRFEKVAGNYQYKGVIPLIMKELS